MTHRALSITAASAAMAVSGLRATAATIYVDAYATGSLHDGTSWCDAFLYLQDALAVASSGDTVRVAKGTYEPDRGDSQTVGDRAASFRLLTGVALEGGFAGCQAADADERDPTLYETLLSGDLNGDDQPGFRNNGENSYHVLRALFADSSAILDGFTIRGGNADGADLDNRGGGLLSDRAHPAIRNCTFRENWGRFGGAMNIENASPTLVNSVFLANLAGFSGGALRAWESSPTIENCLFVRNTAQAGGGAWFGASTPVFRNCTFAENAAPMGNALAFDSCCPQQPSSVYAANCIFWDGANETANADASAISFNYCVVAGGFPGFGNLDEDPLFVPGPAGCFYLSQIASGQSQNSPAIDAGDDSAANLGLDQQTTRSDEVGDTGAVDVGYHFSITQRSFVLGDSDRDLRIDLRDYAVLQECFTGGRARYVPPCCRVFDFESDKDVDLSDASRFASAMTGP